MTRILYVEDDDDIRIILKELLELRGYEVMTAVDGVEGVSHAVALEPDLILMDISLPGKDGWNATREIKDNPRTSHIPIIALTAHVIAGVREKSLRSGCDDYATKPVNMEQLLGKIADLLPAASGQ